MRASRQASLNASPGTEPNTRFNITTNAQMTLKPVARLKFYLRFLCPQRALTTTSNSPSNPHANRCNEVQHDAMRIANVITTLTIVSLWI